MWGLIVSVPDHGLSFYFIHKINAMYRFFVVVVVVVAAKLI